MADLVENVQIEWIAFTELLGVSIEFSISCFGDIHVLLEFRTDLGDVYLWFGVWDQAVKTDVLFKVHCVIDV